MSCSSTPASTSSGSAPPGRGRGAGDSAGDRSDLDGMLEQPAERRVMAGDAGGALTVLPPEIGILVEQGDHRGEPRLGDLAPPAIQRFPVAIDLPRARQ